MTASEARAANFELSPESELMDEEELREVVVDMPEVSAEEEVIGEVEEKDVDNCVEGRDEEIGEVNDKKLQSAASSQPGSQAHVSGPVQMPWVEQSFKELHSKMPQSAASSQPSSQSQLIVDVHTPCPEHF